MKTLLSILKAIRVIVVIIGVLCMCASDTTRGFIAMVIATITYALVETAIVNLKRYIDFCWERKQHMEQLEYDYRMTLYFIETQRIDKDKRRLREMDIDVTREQLN